MFTRIVVEICQGHYGNVCGQCQQDGYSASSGLSGLVVDLEVTVRSTKGSGLLPRYWLEHLSLSFKI